jgi:hypothetical protein
MLVSALHQQIESYFFCKYQYLVSEAGNCFTDQSSENQSSESTFNMQEMKVTLDNLVIAVYNLKSHKDFSKVKQSESSN